MGWTSTKTKDSFYRVFHNEFGRYSMLDVYEHLEEPDSKASEQSTYYCAVSLAGGAVIALVVLFKRIDGEVYWKSMDETAQPFYYDCPKRILDRLTSLEGFATDTTNSTEWRRLCHERNKN